MNKEISIITWNLGNAMYPASHHYLVAQDALKKENIFPVNKSNNKKIISGQIKILKNIDADIMLFQEISKLQPQNYFLNPFKIFEKEFSNYHSVFFSSLNFFNIINQGKATFTKTKNNSVSLNVPYKLKGALNNYIFGNRSLIITKIPISNNKDLVIINIHLTPFERSSKEREKQLEYIFNIAQNEYSKNNWVIIGGDWNVDMPIKKMYKNYSSIGSKISEQLLKDFNLKEWQLVFSNKPTLRSLKMPYSDKCPMSSIDGFLMSKNIKLLNINTISNFDYSDHCPVVIKIKLN